MTLLTSSESSGVLVPIEALRSCPTMLTEFFGGSERSVLAKELNSSYNSGSHG